MSSKASSFSASARCAPGQALHDRPPSPDDMLIPCSAFIFSLFRTGETGIADIPGFEGVLQTGAACRASGVRIEWRGQARGEAQRPVRGLIPCQGGQESLPIGLYWGKALACVKAHVKARVRIDAIATHFPTAHIAAQNLGARFS
jgi:hypothetical protein